MLGWFGFVDVGLSQVSICWVVSS